MLILYEIDDISRFRDEKKLCAYAGIVPSTHASGGKVFHGRITKTGNKWLRWAAIEAAQTAVRSDSEFRAYYQRVRARKGTNAAKVATARRLSIASPINARASQGSLRRASWPVVILE